ncbi:hypothetical protein BHE74_00011531 [Ensete ventricosum]|nr:hypothetical protein GW17_00050991 [Ensete ventricosum]RWW80141.1 hypothetical protein BHE74_00011531 [Ensete ventricosum]RZS13238.1 hypothetical protein BHM03_00044797 [Ensete ventricosum]
MMAPYRLVPSTASRPEEITTRQRDRGRDPEKVAEREARPASTTFLLILLRLRLRSLFGFVSLVKKALKGWGTYAVCVSFYCSVKLPPYP